MSSSGKLLLLPAILAFASCTHVGKSDQFASCNAGSTCELTGKLQVFRGVPASVAVLETTTGKYALALSESDYARLASDNYTATVRGAASRQPNFDASDPNTFVLSYKLNDRWVAVGVCDQCLVIYVDELHVPKIGFDIVDRSAS